MNQETGSRRGTWQWILALFTFASLIETVFWSQVSAFTPLYLPQLGVPADQVATWVGALTAISNAIGIPFLPFWGALADRFARKPIIIRSFVAHLLAGILALLAGNVWVFLIGRSVMSFALGNSGLMLTTLSERTPKNRIGFAFGIMNSAAPLGAFLGPLTGGPIIDRLGFQILLAINVIVMLVVILTLIFGYHDDYQGKESDPILRMAIDSIGIIYHSKRLRALFPALFLLFGGWMLAFTYVPLAITELYTGTEPGTVIGLVMGAGGLITLFLGPLMGVLADRFGHWRVLLVGSAISVMLWPIPGFLRDLVPFAVAWAVLNGVVSGVFAISFSVLSSSAPSNVRGRVMSFAYLPVNVGFMIGPAIGSLIIRISIFAIFPVAAVFTLLGIGVMLIAYRIQQSESA